MITTVCIIGGILLTFLILRKAILKAVFGKVSVVRNPDQFSRSIFFIYGWPSEKNILGIENLSIANDVSLKVTGGLPRDIGWGNIFSLKNDNGTFLCTALHCLENEMRFKSVSIGKDIVLLQDAQEYLDELVPYQKGKWQEGRINIVGFLQKDSGEAMALSITGVPSHTPERVILNGNILETNEFLVLLVRKSKKYDLRGLSGSPVLNKQNEVIGIFSGGIEKSKTLACIISLF